NFDRLYLCGDASPDSPIGSLLAGIPQRIPIQAADDLPLTAVRGLHPQSEQSLFKGNLSVIYPYQLYLAVFGPHGQVVSMTRIPFDFANLELDCNSRYKLASLATADIYGDDENQERIHFALFELSSQSRPELSEPLTALGKAVLEIDCRREDLPQRVDLVLDMGSAALLLDIPAPRVEEDYLARGGFWDLYDRDIARLKQSIDPQSDSSIFPADPALPARAPHSSLDGQIDNTLLRLQWLLNQLQRV
ncbi:MAG: hypothetical protein ABRQ24_11940, partial [Syntrophomonadaceae bacterium]